MDVQSTIVTVIKRTLTFNGRASRGEFWWYVFAVVCANSLLTLLASLTIALLSLETIGLVFLNLFSFLISAKWIVALPLFSAGSRRFHDIGKGTWLYFALLIAVLPIWKMFYYNLGISILSFEVTQAIRVLAGMSLLAVCILPSQPGTNKYGPNPTEASP